MHRLLLFFLFLFAVTVSSAAEHQPMQVTVLPQQLAPGDTLLLTDSLPPGETRESFFRKGENQRLIAALLAFPVPFGISGLHRIYLGTNPWVPVVYFATLGGFGLLPLMDFIFIVTATDDQLKTYMNNGKVFMWVE